MLPLARQGKVVPPAASKGKGNGNQKDKEAGWMQPRLRGCDKSGKDYRPPITTEWFCIAFRVWVLFLSFLGAMPNPSLGCFFLVGSCLSCLGSFFCLFWGRCQIPRLGVSCSSAPAFRVCVVFFAFWGAMPNPSLGCFLLYEFQITHCSWVQITH